MSDLCPNCFVAVDGVLGSTGVVVGVVSRQAVGLATGLHGRRPTGAFAPRIYGVDLESGARSSPDSSGSPQRRDAVAAN